MSDRAYRGIRYDNPAVQAEFEQLVERIRAADRAREPIAERHRQAERALDDATLSEAQFQAIDDEYIAANNTIAAAQRAVDDFLNRHGNYRTS
jgi:hypothetical protein